MGAAVYAGMRITSLLTCFAVSVNTFVVDSACKQLTMASSVSGTSALLTPNNLSDDNWWCVNNSVFLWIHDSRSCNVHLTILDAHIQINCGWARVISVHVASLSPPPLPVCIIISLDLSACAQGLCDCEVILLYILFLAYVVLIVKHSGFL